MRKNISFLLGILGAAGYTVLTVICLFFNPYTSHPSEQDTVTILILCLIVPAVLTFVFVLLSKKLISSIFLFLLTPLTLYFGVGAITTVWKFYLLAWLLLLLSILILPGARKKIS